jgi:hypothetical protein
MFTKSLLKISVAAVGAFSVLGLGIQSASALSITNNFVPKNTIPGYNEFLTVQETGNGRDVNGAGVEEGFNTGASNANLYRDTQPGANTTSLQLSQVPLVGGFRQFILNSSETQQNTGPSITIDFLKIFLSDTANLTASQFDSVNRNFGALAVLVDSLSTPYTYNSNGGLGTVDQLIAVSEASFTAARSGLSANPYVYLYAQFSGVDDGQEEFAVAGINPVPTPALLPGLFALGAGALRKRKQQTAGAIA